MRRSPIGLVIIAILIGFALYSAGAISWTATPWETHTAKIITKDVGKAAKSLGVKVNIPPQPPGITPVPKAPATTTQATTKSTSQAQSVTPVYPTQSGQAIPAPQAQPSITAAYCALEHIASGTDGCP